MELERKYKLSFENYKLLVMRTSINKTLGIVWQLFFKINFCSPKQKDRKTCLVTRKTQNSFFIFKNKK